MNNKKEIEREELHKTIWKIANELRGSVDGWDFKQYVLGLLFYRFISENIENYVNENQRKAGIEDFKYRDISDDEALLGKTQILEEKGLFILPSELFCNVRKNADKNENLNVVISNIFNNFTKSFLIHILFLLLYFIITYIYLLNCNNFFTKSHHYKLILFIFNQIFIIFIYSFL